MAHQSLSKRRGSLSKVFRPAAKAVSDDQHHWWFMTALSGSCFFRPPVLPEASDIAGWRSSLRIIQGNMLRAPSSSALPPAHWCPQSERRKWQNLGIIHPILHYTKCESRHSVICQFQLLIAGQQWLKQYVSSFFDKGVHKSSRLMCWDSLGAWAQEAVIHQSKSGWKNGPD